MNRTTMPLLMLDTVLIKMSKKKANSKPRNWIAVHAFQRSGAGKHKSQKTYTRKTKHKEGYIHNEKANKNR